MSSYNKNKRRLCRKLSQIHFKHYKLEKWKKNLNDQRLRHYFHSISEFLNNGNVKLNFLKLITFVPNLD